MATRKSDFTGDAYGDWVVVDRAAADGGKRRWNVTNTVTGDKRTVLQTELPELATKYAEAFTEPVAGQHVNSTAGLLYLPELHPFAEPNEEPNAYLKVTPEPVGHGRCKHDLAVTTCFACGPKMGDAKGVNSWDIVANVLAANAMQSEAEASVALDNDSEVRTMHMPEIVHSELPAPGGNAFAEAGGDTGGYTELVSGECPSGPACPSGRHGDLGDAVPYDEEEVQAQQDPLRKALRTLLSSIQEFSESLATISALVSVASENTNALLGLADDVLEATFSTPETS